LASAGVGVLVAMSVVTALLSGSWGQGVKNSELLLRAVKAYPALKFVGDDRTIEDLYVLSGLSMPGNVFSVPGTRPEVRELAPPLDLSDTRGVIVIVNPVRDRVFDTTTTDWIAVHKGPTVRTGPVGYRPIGYLLPESLRGRYNFLVRREPYVLSDFSPRGEGVAGGEGVSPSRLAGVPPARDGEEP